jgi:hypothetical protein
MSEKKSWVRNSEAVSGTSESISVLKKQAETFSLFFLSNKKAA